MGFVHQYGPNPETLGAYAFSGSAAKATRENLQRAAEMRQNAAQFNAQLQQHATDRAVILGLLGFATLLFGLVVIMPIVGHASWHAYRDLVE